MRGRSIPPALTLRSPFLCLLVAARARQGEYHFRDRASIGPRDEEPVEAVHQLHRYQRQAPAVLAPNVFCVAADEDEFRYGTVLFHDASNDDIERHLDSWGGRRLRT